LAENVVTCSSAAEEVCAEMAGRPGASRRSASPGSAGPMFVGSPVPAQTELRFRPERPEGAEMTGILAGTGFGLLRTGAGSGTSHSGRNDQFWNGIYNYARDSPSSACMRCTGEHRHRCRSRADELILARREVRDGR
jgi:hypothetical protein